MDVAVEGHFYSFFSQNKKKLKKNASQIFKDLNFSKDDALLLDESLNFMVEFVSNTNESYSNGLMGVNQMTNNLLELWKMNDVYLIPLISDLIIDIYTESVKIMGEDDATVAQIEEMKSQKGEEFLKLALNWHIWKNAPDAVMELPIMTDIFKSEECRGLIHDTNPLIIDEAEMICQWSALFRYIKEKNPEGWLDFVRKVSLLNDSLPEDLRTIWTPVNFDNRIYLFDLFMRLNSF